MADRNREDEESGPAIGEVMPDGTIYAGIAPEPGQAMLTTDADAPAAFTFNEAQEYAAKLDAHRHQDWRVPTNGELDVFFQNREAIGGSELQRRGPELRRQGLRLVCAVCPGMNKAE